MSLTTQFFMQVLAIVSAGSAMGALTAAVATFLSVRDMKSDFYGSGEIDHDRGLVGQVQVNTERSERHERTLEAEGILGRDGRES